MIIYLPVIPLMSFLARASGAAWNRLPVWAEICFAASLAFVTYSNTQLTYLTLLGFIVSYLSFQTGHGNFWLMNGAATPDKPEFIEPFIRKIYKGDIHKPLYSWICMGTKGLGIGLAAFPFGLLLAALWPLAYWINFRLLKRSDSDLAEYIAGTFAGFIIFISL